MEQQALADYLDRCLADYAEKQRKLVEERRLLDYTSYRCAKDGSRIEMRRPDGRQTSFSMIPVGSYTRENGFWLWSWANQANSEAARRRSERLRDGKEKTGLEHFTAGMFQLPEEAVDGLLAMCLDLCSGQGIFRIESEDGKAETYCLLLEETEQSS